MRNLKKALSLALTLALALALAAPAFAVDPEWSLAVTGKTVSEFVMPSASFKQLSWEYYGDDYRKLEDAGTVEWNNVVNLEAGDTMVLTISKPGTIAVKAWSDPDGDGVYDQWMYEVGISMGNMTYTRLPLTTAEPLPLTTYYEGWNSYTYDDECRLTTDGQLGWSGEQMEADMLNDFDSPPDWEEVAVSADYLIQQFGPDTYLEITTYLRPALANYAHYYVYLGGGSRPSAPSAPAQPEQPSASGDSSSISVTVGGTAVMWTDAVPFIDANSRTMVPLRAVADAMELTVNWDGDAREASFSDGSKTIYFPIDSNSARTSDGGAVQMDTAAVIANDRTYAPIRYLAEFFGYTVGWDGATQTVSLTK